MQRQQHQHGSKQPRPPLPARSHQPLRTSKAALSLGKPGWTLALVVLGSAWIVVAVIALTAVSGLLSPNASNGKRPPGTAVIRETTETAQRNSPTRLPLWLFGAIALSCAAGSILISKQANRPSRPRKSTKVKRLAPYGAATIPQPAPSPAPQPQPTYPPPLPSFVLNPGHTQSFSTAPAPFVAPATLMQLAHQEAQGAIAQTDVSATAASEDTHPLDWGKASLADKLDLRKQRSVSPLL